MIIIIIIAFILCWLWIEITLFVSNKKYVSRINKKQFTYKKFIMLFRLFAALLFLLTILYMYFIKNIRFQQALEYCLGIFK